MSREVILKKIAANMEQLRRTDRDALDALSALHREYDGVADEACILAFALSDSNVCMNYSADYDKAIAISQSMLDKFPNSSEGYLIASHLAVMGRCHALSGRHESALAYLTRALHMAEKEPEETRTIELCVDVLHDMAMNNDTGEGDPKQTILFLGKALTKMEGNPRLVIRKGVCLMGLGNVKYTEGKKRAALRHYINAHDIFKETKTWVNLAAACSNIGLVYTELGEISEAVKYLSQSLDLRLETANNHDIAISYINLAQLYDQLHDEDKVYENLLACKEHAMKAGNKQLYLDALLWLESISLKRNDEENVMLFRRERQEAKLL